MSGGWVFVSRPQGLSTIHRRTSILLRGANGLPPMIPTLPRRLANFLVFQEPAFHNSVPLHKFSLLEYFYFFSTTWMSAHPSLLSSNALPVSRTTSGQRLPAGMSLSLHPILHFKQNINFLHSHNDPSPWEWLTIHLWSKLIMMILFADFPDSLAAMVAMWWSNMPKKDTWESIYWIS